MKSDAQMQNGGAVASKDGLDDALAPCDGIVVLPGSSMLRFNVSSLTQPGKSYLVDLSLWKGYGECECDRFMFRCMPKLHRGMPMQKSWRCNHIRRAREYFTDQMIMALIQQERKA